MAEIGTDSTGALAFLLDQFPLKHQILLPPAFESAYAAVNTLVAETPFLKVPSARFNRGRLITWAVDHAVENLIQAGRWKVDYRWASFGEPESGKYLEIVTSHSRLTISQIKNPAKQPRNVSFRENARVFNSPFLFQEMEADKILGRPSLLITHGHKDLSFIHVAIPHARRKYGYICKSTNLMMLPKAVTMSGPKVEDTSFNFTMTLKNQIAKWLRDNGG